MRSKPYSLRIWADEKAAAEVARLKQEDAKVNWHLFARGDVSGSEFSASEATAIEVTDLPLTDITPFLVVTVSIQSEDNETLTFKTVVLADLLNDVPTRRDEVMAQQVTDRATFMRLLTLLLGLSGLTSQTVEQLDGLTSYADGSAGQTSGYRTASLLEPLLRALVQGHEGIETTQKIVSAINSREESDDVFPPGFMELWTNVWKVHKARRGSTR